MRPRPHQRFAVIVFGTVDTASRQRLPEATDDQQDTPVKHHYVPAYYLRAFPELSLGALAALTRFPLPVESQLSERFVVTQPRPGESSVV